LVRRVLVSGEVVLVERVSTGVSGLDDVLEGGFPKGSLIVLAGNPGTGKTVFAAQFIYRGAAGQDEPGVYVSFAENREAFIENMKGFGFNFETLEKKGKFRFLDLLTVREAGVSTVLSTVVDAVEEVKAKRLVIDSYTALAQAFEKPFDSRIVTHTLLGKIVRQAGCTSLIIGEVPYRGTRIGTGMEEFVADGVLLFRAGELDGRLFRDLEIKKMRGTRIAQNTVAFTLHRGFEAFPKFVEKPLSGVFKPIPDSTEKFSSGSTDLDRLLDGGYPKGSTVLLEMGLNVSTLQYHLLLTVAWNFIANDRPVFVIPSSGVDPNLILNRARDAGFSEEKIERLIRICEFKGLVVQKHPCLIEFKGESLEEDFQTDLHVASEAHARTGQPILHIIGVDRIISYYGLVEALKILNLSISLARQHGDLMFFLLKPSIHDVSANLNSIVDVHFKVVREHGALLVYGLKPRTQVNFVEIDTSAGYTVPKLTPIS